MPVCLLCRKSCELALRLCADDALLEKVVALDNPIKTEIAFFDLPYEIRRLIYTYNAIEGYNCQLCKIT